MNDGSGPPPWTRFAVFGPDGSCGRTRVLSLDLGMENPSDGFSAKWPKQGTWDSGGAYALPTSERPTVGSECSSLLPTLSASNPNDGEDLDNWLARRERVKAQGTNGNGFGTPLAVAVKMLPTPRASPIENRQTRRSPSQEAGRHGKSLAAEVGHLLPTPTSRDHKGRNQRDDDPCLPGAVGKLPPTPTAGDSKSTRNRTAEGSWDRSKAHDGTTLTDAAALIGASTSPPSGDGSDSSALPLPLWTDEDD